MRLAIVIRQSDWLLLSTFEGWTMCEGFRSLHRTFRVRKRRARQGFATTIMRNPLSRDSQE